MAQNPQAAKSSRNKSISLLQLPLASILQNPLNSSPSKMQYSMPKAKRFIQLKPNQGKYYDLPEAKSKRSASLGYGNKLQFGKQLFLKPAPGQYELKSDFNTDNKKKGITLAAGRQVVKSNSLFDIPIHIPGPGAYTHKSDFEEGKEKKGYSLSSRNPDLSGKWLNSIPGPGVYETIDVLEKNMNSKIQNIRVSKFSKQQRKSQFDSRIRENIPGPGQYQQTEKLHQITAKFEVNKGSKFSNGQRQGIISKEKVSLPGPGAYNSFSQFLH